jgi:uncharacterized membrane protein YcfT
LAETSNSLKMLYECFELMNVIQKIAGNLVYQKIYKFNLRDLSYILLFKRVVILPFEEFQESVVDQLALSMLQLVTEDLFLDSIV